MTDSPPLELTPRMEPVIQSVLAENALLHQLADGLGSPLNIVLPEALAPNVESFRAVYRRHRLRGHIYFAHKANRSAALLRQLAATEAGVDVASLAELQHALGAGFTPDRVIATGPKNREFLWLAARTGVLVNADSLDEVSELAALVAVDRLPRVRVMVRLSGFASHGVRLISRRSRFGVPADRPAEALDRLEKHADQLELVGVAYHLDTIGQPEKAVALEGCLAAIDECRRRDVGAWSIDIGGGFGVNYLADAGQWERYTSELAQAVLGRRPPMTWNGHGYGLRNEGGTLRGALGLYPAYRPVSGPGYLDQLLATPAPEQRRPLGELLLDSMIDLDIEPGRALLDQCGLVLSRVLEVRTESSGLLVRLEMNARDVSLEEHGVLMDPVLVGRAEDEPTEVFLLGNLCLESDLITRRKVTLSARPRPGDLLAFVNTAGYFMDFSATAALRQPIGRKVALYRDDGRWGWCLDEQYWPVHERTEAA
ncbi:Y4yA family PLP-dependent enzyme [Paractinoplanes brasiliensis]|uniref:Diaminopimelate decarboxylase n=1 Tax=Paractinoplanes brasiliensis TaxID=52695 RepID=A0A4R6JT84_9ACTN|nr:Y4yA family PLP-dependent enzyme [Actinoplanes brasiliensis]TDO39709.1 diaminopimelate decarboxylase [Actinoplanes brasiliensis]GID28954.1 diaminopimelate decarboxylase [Actinoplanes brasiliensis]